VRLVLIEIVDIAERARTFKLCENEEVFSHVCNICGKKEDNTPIKKNSRILRAKKEEELPQLQKAKDHDLN